METVKLLNSKEDNSYSCFIFQLYQTVHGPDLFSAYKHRDQRGSACRDCCVSFLFFTNTNFFFVLNKLFLSSVFLLRLCETTRPWSHPSKRVFFFHCIKLHWLLAMHAPHVWLYACSCCSVFSVCFRISVRTWQIRIFIHISFLYGTQYVSLWRP